MKPSLEHAIDRLATPLPDSCLTGLQDRTAALRAIADQLVAEADSLAQLMAQEMGKPVSQGRSEAEKCAWVCRYYADHAEAFLADETLETGRAESFVTHAPMGIVLAVMPWNFPFWQVFRFAAPALAAGNRILLKHASNVPGCAAAIERIITQATGRDDLLVHVTLPGKEVAELIADPRTAAVTFTGSTQAGRQLAAACGQHLKKCVLELGGSDPYLILEDADIAHAAATCAKARMINNGQSCIAAKRLIVAAPVHDAFVELLRHELSQYEMADPLDPNTRLGPLARTDLRDTLHDQVQRGLATSARLILGGKIPQQPGPWYPATLVAGVRRGTPLFDEETFGPVAAISRVHGASDGIELANATHFGLGAAVFTEDLDLAHRVARQLKAGTVGINAQVVSDPRLPFGGTRESGWGRELGRAGILEFVDSKTILREIPKPDAT
ncbi:succinate-semialdehyde dehydrogenase/glutarate-semialdehyde dehydrogenase [Haloferula luteola]|uniref:Succinate-semialdehyde dehydrogenase/glutarate-semialdehyde dehydrogenase n=1 Tax=Haloferula luteola TaxID=595692 RepID=A0A840V403_9BACT|nr:NAD-dependent succinate-semialdehyde dehydrogenase [Haloferula luteola]MBB5351786.1 succinate-semialdehyde dehydrogenase/glutarate-semialdehyde dehydrogenase [Haloferula luteola]